MNHRACIRSFPWVLLLIAVPALAATPSWTLLGPPGGTVTALAVDPQDARIVYAATHGGEGIFKSVDGGVTWSPSGEGLSGSSGNGVYCLAIDPRRPAILYAGTLNFGIYKSIDGGASWSPLRGLSAGSVLGVYDLAIDPARPDVVFAATGVGVFETTDGGAHWKARNGGLPPKPSIDDLAIDPGRTSVVYAAVGNSGLYKSVDGGATWAPKNGGLPAGQAVQTLAIDPRRPATIYASTYAGLYKSTNGGGSWSPSNAGLPKAIVKALVIDPRSSRTLYAATFFGTGVFRSDDAGASWSPIDDGLSNRTVWSLAANAQGTILYAGTDGDLQAGGVFQSADGRTWRRTVRGLSALQVSVVAAEAPPPGSPAGSPTALWAGTPSLGVFRSPDGGGTWRQVRIAGVSGPVNSIVVDPIHPGRAYVLAYGPDAGTVLIHLYETTDAGRTWARLAYPRLGDGPFSGLTRDPRTGTLWLLGTGLARSTDGGATWTAADAGIDLQDLLTDVAFDPSSPQVLYAAGFRPAFHFEPSEERLYKSLDGGASWARVDDPALAATHGLLKVVVSPVSSQVVMVTSFGALFRSTDAGTHWTQVAEAPQNGPITDLVAGPDGTLYAATGTTGVYTSRDGLSWTALGGLASPDALDLAVDPLHPRILYAGTESAGIERCAVPR